MIDYIIIRRRQRMKYKQYNKVVLKTGEVAVIVEVLGNGVSYVADIEKESGTDTEFIDLSDIKQKYI